MIKELDDERLIGRKCYFNSRGLFEPEVEYGTDAGKGGPFRCPYPAPFRFYTGLKR